MRTPASEKASGLFFQTLQKWSEDQSRDPAGRFSSSEGAEEPEFHSPPEGREPRPVTPVERFSPKQVKQELGMAEDRMKRSVADLSVAENSGKKSGWAGGTVTMLTSSALSALRASISGLDRLAGDNLDPDTKAAADRAKHSHAEAKQAFISGGPSELIGQKIRNALSATAVYYSHVARNKAPSRVAASVELDGIRKILSEASFALAKMDAFEAMLCAEAKYRAMNSTPDVMRRFL